MMLGTVIKFADGRIGTICMHSLIGCGGVWGEQDFDTPEIRQAVLDGGGFTDVLPRPDFVLRGENMRRWFPVETELMGEHSDFEVVKDGFSPWSTAAMEPRT